MASRSGEQNHPSHASESRANAPTPRPSTAMQADHVNTSRRTQKPTTTSIPAKPKDISNAPESAPMQLYLRSDEPAARRVKAAVSGRQHQTLRPQAEARYEVVIDDGTNALEEWMAEVTAHPERAIWFRDFDRLLPSTAQLYVAQLSDEGSAARGDQPADSQDSMQPMLFCSCCPPGLTMQRS
jgi:hypothetical protein